MGKVTKAVSHLKPEEILERMKQTVGFWRVQKWLVILNATVDPRPAKTLALHTGLAEQTVHNLVSSYNRHGPNVLETPGKGGRRRAYLTLLEESAFLQPFIESAFTGQVATAAEIKRSLEKLLGRKVHKTTVYRLLERHGWRKLVPRPFHEQAKADEQEAFKKTP
jgi:transposase